MPLPRLRFTTENAKSALLTTDHIDRCPFSLVNSDEAHEFVKEAHGNLLGYQGIFNHPPEKVSALRHISYNDPPTNSSRDVMCSLT
jgi:hypothetical protein